MASFDRDKLTPEQIEILDFGYAEAAKKSEAAMREFEKMKKDHQDALRKLTDKDNAIKATEEEKKSYQARLEELENAGKSEKEKLEIALKKAEEAKTTALKSLEAEKESWRSRYLDSLKSKALMEASADADLYDPGQLEMMLSGKIQIKEVKNGDSIDYQPYLTLPGEDGTPVEHKLKDGVKVFLGKHPNLIKSKIIRDEDKLPEGVIVRNSDGSVKKIDLANASVEEINAHFEQLHAGLGEVQTS